MRRLLMLGLALGSTLAAGCGSDGRSVSERSTDLERVPLARLPDLPGCGTAMPTTHGVVSLREIADDAALYVVYLGTTPVCVDDLQGVFGASFLTDDEIARAFDGTPVPARGGVSALSNDVGDGTPLPAMPSVANDVGDGTPLPARKAGDGDDGSLSAAQAAGSVSSSNPTTSDGTPLPARGGADKSGKSDQQGGAEP